MVTFDPFNKKGYIRKFDYYWFMPLFCLAIIAYILLLPILIPISLGVGAIKRLNAWINSD